MEVHAYPLIQLGYIYTSFTSF